MEELKESVTSTTGSKDVFDIVNQERQYKARINNNCQFIRAQNQTYGNISSTDRMIAYSLNQNCQSIAKTRHQQITSLINRFKQIQQVEEENNEEKKAFKNIISNRFQRNEQAQEEEVMDEEDEVEIEDEDEDEGDYDEEELPENEQNQQQSDQREQQPESHPRQDQRMADDSGNEGFLDCNEGDDSDDSEVEL